MRRAAVRRARGRELTRAARAARGARAACSARAGGRDVGAERSARRTGGRASPGAVTGAHAAQDSSAGESSRTPGAVLVVAREARGSSAPCALDSGPVVDGLRLRRPGASRVVRPPQDEPRGRTGRDRAARARGRAGRHGGRRSLAAEPAASSSAGPSALPCAEVARRVSRLRTTISGRAARALRGVVALTGADGARSLEGQRRASVVVRGARARAVHRAAPPSNAELERGRARSASRDHAVSGVVRRRASRAQRGAR